MTGADHEVLVTPAHFHEGVTETRAQSALVHVLEVVVTSDRRVIDEENLIVIEIDSHTVDSTRPHTRHVIESLRRVIQPVQTRDGEEPERTRASSFVLSMPTLPVRDEIALAHEASIDVVKRIHGSLNSSSHSEPRTHRARLN
jgi:hypothetical protein